MNFDPNLSYNVRITKRKFNKVRFFSLLGILIVCTLCGLFLFNSDFHNGIMNIFTSSPKEKVSLKVTQSKDANQVSLAETTQNAATVNTTDKSGLNTTSNTASTSIKQEEKKVIRDYVPLKNDISSFISAYKGEYGVYFMDLDNGGEFGINDLDTFVAASTVKVPINLLLFKKIEDGSINPNDLMTYNKDTDYEEGTGYIQTMPDGSKFTIRELSKLSITISDNVAANMLIRLLGTKNYKDFMRNLGGAIVTNKNVSCPKDMAIYMKAVYDLQKSNKELGEELIDYLESTVFNDRIPKLLPQDVKVAHKIGNFLDDSWGFAFHDVGIVYSDNDYILSVMSKNAGNEAEACDVIANISKKVYDFMATKN